MNESYLQCTQHISSSSIQNHLLLSLVQTHAPTAHVTALVYWCETFQSPPEVALALYKHYFGTLYPEMYLFLNK